MLEGSAIASRYNRVSVRSAPVTKAAVVIGYGVNPFGVTRGDKLFLQCDGDGTLSRILSKALAPPEDRNITDPTIVSQHR